MKAEDHIRIFRILQQEGIDVSQIPTSRIPLKEVAERQGKSIEEITKKHSEIKGDMTVSTTIVLFRRGEIETTDAQKKELTAMGILGKRRIIAKKRKSKVAKKYIHLFHVLQEEGVDVGKIPIANTPLSKVIERQGKSPEEIAKKHPEIELNLRLGNAIEYMKNGTILLTEEQKKEISQMGINLTKKRTSRGGKKFQHAVPRYLNIFSVLEQEGIQVSQIPVSNITIEEAIKRQGKSAKEIAAKYPELDLTFHIGASINALRRGNIQMTEEEKQKLTEYGVLGAKRVKSSISSHIQTLKNLQQEGIDVSQIPFTDITLEKAIQKQGKSAEEILEKYANLKPTLHIGRLLENLSMGNIKMTEEQKAELEQMGAIGKTRNLKREITNEFATSKENKQTEKDRIQAMAKVLRKKGATDEQISTMCSLYQMEEQSVRNVMQEQTEKQEKKKSEQPEER